MFAEVLATPKVTPPRGTFKLHAVVGLGDASVAYRETSCYCQTCINNELCSGWTVQQLHVKPGPDVTQENRPDEPRASDGISGVMELSNAAGDKVNVRVVEGDYVAAMYEKACYIGKVCQIDEEDGGVEITFMEKKKQLFQWPTREDTLWILPHDILCKLSEPVASRKSRGMFKMDSEEMRQALSLAENHRNNS